MYIRYINLEFLVFSEKYWVLKFLNIGDEIFYSINVKEVIKIRIYICKYLFDDI